jgi:hypothetical protein
MLLYLDRPSQSTKPSAQRQAPPCRTRRPERRAPGFASPTMLSVLYLSRCNTTHIQARITERRVVQTKILLREPSRPTGTLRNILARHFQMHAPQITIHLLMNLQRLLQLAEDILEAPGLDHGAAPIGAGDGCVPPIPVHGVTLPDDGVPGGLDGADVRGEELGDLVGAVAGDEDDLADLAEGVEDVEERGEFGGGHGGADFDADGVGEAAEEFDVCVR